MPAPLHSRSLRFLVLATLLLPVVLTAQSLSPGVPAARAEGPLNGYSAACVDMDIALEPLFSQIDAISEYVTVELADEGWVPVDPRNRFQSVTGVVAKSKIAYNDTPGNHDSHDQNTDIVVDPGLEFLVSDVNHNNENDPRPHDQIEMEWEIGTYTDETGKFAPERYFPKWAWPNIGDRVWVNGHWVFDCGHATTVDGESHYRSEIHPARAIASMRDQLATLPGTGTTPVRVTSTDIWIHGRAGYITEMLYCGMEIVIDGDRCDQRVTPIDEDFTFDIPLPPKPAAGAILTHVVVDRPGNTLDIAPEIVAIPEDDPTALRVTIPLAGTGATGADAYARNITAGWIVPPAGLRRLDLSLFRMDLHDDKELDPGDCECTFFWLNVDRDAGHEWIRLSDYADGNMNDYDDDGFLGDGFMTFTGADFDFYVAHGQDVTIRATGYDQDCLDSWFQDPGIHELTYVDCYATLGPLSLNHGQNDPFTEFNARAVWPSYAITGVSGSCTTRPDPFRYDCTNKSGSEYELEIELTEIPLTVEDDSDLTVTKSCTDVVRSDEAIVCTITVANAGPGLPPGFTLEDTIATNIALGDYTVGDPVVTLHAPGIGSADATDCSKPNGAGVSCLIPTVPVGGTAEVVVTIVPAKGGTLTNTARLVGVTGDADLSDNEASDVVTVIQVIQIDIRPGDATNPVKVGLNGGGGKIPVAILSEPDFDAPARVHVASLTFGRTGTESSFVSCAKNPVDINGDGLRDLICHFSNDPRLFQAGDRAGILSGQTRDSPAILIEGTDTVTPVP